MDASSTQRVAAFPANWKQALCVLQGSQQVRDWDSASSSCAKAKEWGLALELLKAVYQRATQSCSTRNILILAFEKGQQWPKACQLLSKDVDIISYNTIISHTSHISHPSHPFHPFHWSCCLLLLQSLQTKRLRPTRITLNAAARAASARWRGALELLTPLLGSSGASVVSYGTAVASLPADQWRIE